MMSDEQQTVIEPRPAWSRKKIGLLIFAVIVLVGASLFQFAAGKVRQVAEQTLLVQANEAVNGQVIVGGIDLSILGSVEAKEVQVLDAAGKLLAKISRIQISYSWSDLLKGQLGPQLVTGVVVEKPEVWVVYNQDKLNWDGLLKTKQEQEEASFAGLVEVEGGKLHVETAFFAKTVDQLTGNIDFRQADQLGFAASGKVDETALKLGGQWGSQGTSEINLSAAGMDLAKLGLTSANDPIQLTGGRLDELTVKLGKDASGAVLLQTLAGRFSGIATTGALALTQGSARFEKQDKAIQFLDGQALYRGQSVTGAGRVLTSVDGTQTLDFAVQMPAADPAALVPSLKTGGMLAAQGTITGPVLSPVLAGNFTLGSIQFDDIVVNGITGAFSYAQETMKLLTAHGTSLGGSVSASGDIDPDTEQYSLSVSGSGLDSSKLTDKDVKGPLSFTGTASGDAAAAVVQGNFAIDNGKAYGISFRTLTGSFIKQGSAATEIGNLVIKTDIGTFYPEQLSQNVMERLQERKLPVTKEEVREAVTDKLIQKLFR
ncbi:conserved hypothetical protein [uncultured Sporomusa sp.]|uniref:AsmA-like C-terminal domain-containing protein n=1 Tax=uncultured Sporomusa sp. TaxID=307249 RepID=A0A212LXH2_9FIRM|nr:hypothetical protein [uncultured Sporomusa sp.]SCM82196.1 conserved hypothetical protein [uncultured Sporomusa sp.]